MKKFNKSRYAIVSHQVLTTEEAILLAELNDAREAFAEAEERLYQTDDVCCAIIDSMPRELRVKLRLWGERMEPTGLRDLIAEILGDPEYKACEQLDMFPESETLH